MNVVPVSYAPTTTHVPTAEHETAFGTGWGKVLAFDGRGPCTEVISPDDCTAKRRATVLVVR
jgi:hypothetical protein